jgi:AraC-like DNA-binding protein
VGLSRFKFSKMFHKSLHVTFQAHLLEKRLQWAHYALQSANAPIAVIAEQAGFRSRSYFCSKFKSRFGVSPTEMKRKSIR